MSWQDELRRLDAELTSGRLEHSEYRKLRDELLASASGGGLTSPVAAPRRTARTNTSQPVWKSTNPGIAPKLPAAPAMVTPAPVVPEPPAVDQPTVEHPAVRKTPSSASLLATDKPTTAPSPADYRRTDVMPHPSQMPARTGRRPHLAPPPLLPVPTQPMSPPSGGAPVARADQSRHKPTWLFVSLGVLVVLAAIIGGAWWVGVLSGGDQPNAQAPTAPPTQVALEDRLPRLPGTPNPNNSTMAVDKGVEVQLYSAEDAALIKKSGANEVIYRGSGDGPGLADGYKVLVIPTPSAENASALVRALEQSATAQGFADMPPGPEQLTKALVYRTPVGRVARTWYTSQNVAVGVEVSQALGSAEAELRQRLQRTTTSVKAVLPGR
jgi:hypothetical protein